MGFNPRARDGREDCINRPSDNKKSFNPRARDGREALSVTVVTVTFVSIHAPVMDAN